MSIFTQSHSKYTKTVKIVHFRSINAMKHIKTANTWNLAANAQPQIPTLNLSIKFVSDLQGPSVGAPLGWRSASFFSHFSTPGSAGLRSALILSHFSRLSLEFWGSASHQKTAHILVFVGRCFTWFHDPNWHLHGNVV